MAVRINAPALLLSGEDCVVLDAMLGVAVVELRRRHSVMPPMAQQIVDGIHRTADQFRASVHASVHVEAGLESVRDDSGFVSRSSEAAGELSAQDVARLSGVSTQFVCLLARRGVLHGTRSGTRGAWRLDAGSVAIWQAARGERADKAA